MARTSNPPDNEAIRELRNTLNKLNKSIKKFTEASASHSEKVIKLTLILFAVAFLQVFISLSIISSNWGEWLLLSFAIMCMFFLIIIRPLFQAKKRLNKSMKKKIIIFLIAFALGYITRFCIENFSN